MLDARCFFFCEISTVIVLLGCKIFFCLDTVGSHHMLALTVMITRWVCGGQQYKLVNTARIAGAPWHGDWGWCHEDMHAVIWDLLTDGLFAVCEFGSGNGHRSGFPWLLLTMFISDKALHWTRIIIAGKSSLVERLVHDKFEEGRSCCTVGAAYAAKRVCLPSTCLASYTIVWYNLLFTLLYTSLYVYSRVACNFIPPIWFLKHLCQACTCLVSEQADITLCGIYQTAQQACTSQICQQRPSFIGVCVLSNIVLLELQSSPELSLVVLSVIYIQQVLLWRITVLQARHACSCRPSMGRS